MTLPTENIQPVQPNKPPKTIPWNKWTITGFIIGGLFLVGIGGAMGGGTPEPEVITKTETVTKKVQDTSRIDQLEDKLDTCETVVVDTWKALKRRNDLFAGILDEIGSNFLSTDFNGITERIEADNLTVGFDYIRAEQCTSLTEVGF